jgi:hypothetical protein
VRVEADIRLPDGSSGGVVVRYRDDANYAVARLDSRTRSVVVEVVVNGVRTQLAAQPLAADFPFGVWHNVAVEVRGTAMTVEVTDARLNDPYAVVKVTLPTALSSGGPASRRPAAASTPTTSAPRSSTGRERRRRRCPREAR